METQKVYLDYHATTPVDPEVLEAMLPYFSEKFGNAASKAHRWGFEAEVAVEHARQEVAQLIGANAEEIIFTSGATESNNLALLGIAEAHQHRGNKIISGTTEHQSVLDPLRHLEKEKFQVQLLPVETNGHLNLNLLKSAVDSQTILVSWMAANNEIGTIHPIEKISEIAHSKKALLHCDGVQAVGKISVDVQKMGIDLLSMSAHKMYGPKGIGALYVKKGTPIAPQIYGGGHERGLRSGTVNVPGIVGFGKACAIAQNHLKEESLRLQKLRDHLYQSLKEKIPHLKLNGDLEARLPHNLNVIFPQIKSEVLMMNLKEIALSAGATCASANAKLSHVLQAIELSREEIECSIRFGLGRFTNLQEIDYVTHRIIDFFQKNEVYK